MNQITPISADSNRRDDVYRLLNMVHAMAGRLAQTKEGGWHLKKVGTREVWALTTWSNGIVDIEAETFKAVEGVRDELHCYRLLPVSGEDNDK